MQYPKNHIGKNAEYDDEPIQLFSKNPDHFIYNQMDHKKWWKLYIYFDDSMIHLYIQNGELA